MGISSGITRKSGFDISSDWNDGPGQGGVIPYDPGMMTYDGSTGYYTDGYTAAGNAVTCVFRINRDAFTGGSSEMVTDCRNGSNQARFSVQLWASDGPSGGDYRNGVLQIGVRDTVNTAICLVYTDVRLDDGADHTVFFAYDGTAGTVQLYVDGVDAEDGTAADRVLTTGTLNTGAFTFRIGNNLNGFYFGGQIGYFGYSNSYLTNPTDFHHPTNGLQELDESGWTEWGAQPLYWNQYGQMTDNRGSAGNMTANGTITGPA